MEVDFVPYQEALELKALGFDELCLAVHYEHKWSLYSKSRGIRNSNKIIEQWLCTAPTFSQAFRWFRENYGLWFRPDYYDETRAYNFQGSIHKLGKFSSLAHIGDHNNAEEAELACLRKLIEIVKSKQ